MTIDQQITFLPTADLDRATAFYQDVLELVLVRDQGTCRIFRVTESAFVGLCAHLDAAGGVITTFVVADVAGWCRRLAIGGVSCEGPTHSDRYAITHAFFSDPDGNRLEIQRFDEPL